MIVHIIEAVYHFLWGDLVTLHLSGTSIGIPLLVLLLIPTGIYFTFRTNFVSVRLFPDMVRSLTEKKGNGNSLSPLQTLFVSTATRVGMGNLVGVVAAVSAGGAGAVFWMWLSAILGSATAFIEATLAQIHKEEDSLYGGYHGGPAYYIHYYAEKVRGKKLNHSVIAVFFALSGLLCWCGISQVISNSVASAFKNAFSVPPIITTVILVILSAIIVLRKNATIKALDIIVPVMAAMYFIITIFIIVTHIGQLPGVFSRIFKEAFGLRAKAKNFSMEDMAEYARRLLVMNQGELVMDGTPKEIFGRYKELEKMGLSAPKMTYLMHSLAEKGYDLSTDILTVSDAAGEILNLWRKTRMEDGEK